MEDPKHDTPIVTIEQAKDFFRQMGCSHFHMAREFPERYKEYQRLKIQAQLETEWRKEKFDEYHGEILGDTGISSPIWMIHSSMYDLYESLRTDEELVRLLEVTRHIREKVPPHERIMVAETINGRMAHQVRRGLIYISYDMGKVYVAREFAELSLRFSEYKDNDMNEATIAKIYGDIPLQFLRHKDYKSYHMERCQRATNQCNEIRNELGL